MKSIIALFCEYLTDLLSQSLLQRFGKLVGTRCSTPTAINPTQPFNGSTSIHSLDQSRNTLRIATTTAKELYADDYTVVNLGNDCLRAGTVREICGLFCHRGYVTTSSPAIEPKDQQLPYSSRYGE